MASRAYARGHVPRGLNSDAERYAGSGGGNFGSIEANEQPWHGQPASAEVYLPGLSTLWFAAE